MSDYRSYASLLAEAQAKIEQLENDLARVRRQYDQVHEEVADTIHRQIDEITTLRSRLAEARELLSENHHGDEWRERYMAWLAANRECK